ncbi:hypothetical protein NPX13_g3093 [Xylaria arbuscula]|uniref:Uncharacterized protein n=1 Tax=Xylaria arbuscula TaxID=114810 RepID=A0A9W8TNJ5_9PEZI|nr:hypothetical protein NPX13_g3093 [Xylaria arbuscula]
MRHNVAISTLFACLIGLATADGTDNNLGQENSSSNASLVFNPLTTYPVFQLTPNAATTFTFENHTVLNVNTVKLKRYDPKGAENGQNDEIVTEYSGAATGAPATAIGEEKPSLNLSDHTVLIQWTQDVSDYYNKLFYVECEWTNSVGAGNSTSEIFAPYQETNTIAKTLYLDQKDKARDFHSQEAIAARGELFTATPSPPSPTKNAGNDVFHAYGQSTRQHHWHIESYKSWPKPRGYHWHRCGRLCSRSHHSGCSGMVLLLPPMPQPED